MAILIKEQSWFYGAAVKLETRRMTGGIEGLTLTHSDSDDIEWMLMFGFAKAAKW